MLKATSFRLLSIVTMLWWCQTSSFFLIVLMPTVTSLVPPLSPLSSSSSVSSARRQRTWEINKPSIARFYTDDKNGNQNNKDSSNEWLDRSLMYYSKVMREKQRRKRLELQEKQQHQKEEKTSAKSLHDIEAGEEQGMNKEIQLGGQEQWGSQSDEQQVDDYLDNMSHQHQKQQQLERGKVYRDTYLMMAAKHYFALRKIKDGKPGHAELIYRKIITELEKETDDGHCDHAKLAVTTLLLALLMQRLERSPKDVRSVFLHFFRVAIVEASSSSTSLRSSSTSDLSSFVDDNGNESVEGDDGHSEGSGGCACTAKVLQAYALFEMKQGNSRKSLQLVMKAIEMDPTLEPVLKWKQFRDVRISIQQRQLAQPKP